MTAPVWAASPPEVHSALLSNGPGPGPLLAAAQAWSSLSETYASAAAELTSLLAAVQAGPWQGPSAQQYTAANVPYVAWLLQAGADSAATARQHEVAASAYTVALAAMPTLAELAANHAIHAVLVTTNFFGINTIPIALNEADYARMWVQAATTMSSYQAVSTAAVAATPQTTPAPQIVKANAASAQTVGYQGEPYPNPTNLSQTLADLNYNVTAAVANFNGPTDPTTWTQFGQFWSTTSTNVSSGLSKELASLTANPSAIFSYPTLLWVLDFAAGRIFDVIVSLKFILTQPGLYAVGLGVAIANLGAVVSASSGLVGFAGLAGLGALPSGAEMTPVGVHPWAAPLPLTPVTAVSVSPVSAPTLAPTSAPAAAPVAPAPTVTVAGSGPPPPPAPAGPGGFPYLVGSLSLTSAASDSAKEREPESVAAAVILEAAATVDTGEPDKARRRRRMKSTQLGRGYEYMDLSVTASEQGAGTLGFAGTAKVGERQAAGLTTVSGDRFGAEPTLPMLPGSWRTHDNRQG